VEKEAERPTLRVRVHGAQTGVWEKTIHGEFEDTDAGSKLLGRTWGMSQRRNGDSPHSAGPP